MFYYATVENWVRRCMRENDEGRTVRAVEHACEILEATNQKQPTSPSDLAESVDLTPGALHTQLVTLHQKGFIIKRADGYMLGPQLLPLGESVRNSFPVHRAGKEMVDKLADETGECAHLTIEHDGQRIAVYESFGSNAVGTDFYKKKQERPQNLLHCTASGKALLAHTPEGYIREILHLGDLTRLTEQTITDSDTLFEELEAVRERGYATNDEEEIPGIRAVGVPIMDGNGEAAAALSVSGPKSRLTGGFYEGELPDRLIDAANVVEVNLQTPEI